VKLLSSSPQQAVVRRILYQRVLKAKHRVGRRTALEYQLGSDEPAKSGLQIVLRKTRNGLH
jgi:hypothetical protein